MTTSYRKTIDFTEGPIGKPLLMFALPLLAGNLLQQTYSIADSVIVGRFLGNNALAAIGASSPVTRLSIAFMIGFTLGVSVVVSQHFGSHDEEGVRRTIFTSYAFFLLVSFAISIIGFILSPTILRIMDTPESALEDAISYLQLSFIGTLFMVGYNVSSSIFRGIGNSRIPLFMLLLSTIINVFLDVIFVVVLGMGVAGTAWATIISQAVSFLFSFIYFIIKYPEYVLWKKQHSLDLHLLKKILCIGVPSGLKGSMYWLGYVLITSLVNSYGTSTIAAFSIASKIDSFVQTPMTALSSSLATYVGQNVGARKADRITSGVKVGIGIAISFAIIMSTSVFILADRLMSMFTIDQEVVKIGVRYLRIVSALYIIYVLEEVPQGVAIGCGDTLWLLLSTICAMWCVRLPLSYMLSSMIGIDGIWISMPSGWFVALIFCGGYFLSGYWKRKCIYEK